MEPTRNRGHLITSRALLLKVLLLLFISVPVTSLVPNPEGPTCPEGEFLTDEQICCTRCHPGTKLVEKCHGPDSRTRCTRCPAGQYMDKINYHPNCFSCDSCKDNEIQVLPCTNKQNRVCRCKDGFYKSVIDSRTYQCLPCSKCGDNKREEKKCSPEGDTECRCRDDHYRLENKCQPCTNCTNVECSMACTPLRHGTGKVPQDPQPFLVNVIAGAAVAVVLTLVLVVVVTHFVTKRQTKKKLLSSQENKDSPEIYEEFTAHFEELSDHSLHSVPLHAVISQEPSNLPDFIPLEIKIPDVIYTLLDSVPVLQVKQLVRSLGVSDSVIERAELDHRSSKEAQYQMLRAWAEQGSQGRGGGRPGGVLHLPLLHQLLDKLRLMHLEQTAQELETKYNLL